MHSEAQGVFHEKRFNQTCPRTHGDCGNVRSFIGPKHGRHALGRGGWFKTIAAEWHARQLLLIASEPGPSGNMRSPNGRSTSTDLKLLMVLAASAADSPVVAQRSVSPTLKMNLLAIIALLNLRSCW